MATATRKTADDVGGGEGLDRLASQADDDAAQLAMDVESLADACEIVSRRVAELRTEVAQHRVKLAELTGARR